MTHAEANPATERPTWAQALALVLAFLGGGIGGFTLSGRLAPDSALAQFVGLFSFSRRSPWE